MAKVYYSISLIVSIFTLTACGPGSPPSSNSATYQLNMLVNPAEGGSVLPEFLELNEGDEVIISALPNEGWLFVSWQGDHSGSSNPDTLIVNNDLEINALFLKRDYPLTILIEGQGVVSEKIIQPKTTDYPLGTIVELTAEPSDGWQFSEWIEGDSITENPIQMVVEDEIEITAHFEKSVFSLTIEVKGNGGVDKILQSGNEIDGSYEFESVIELTASADVGWGFYGWEGDIQGDQNRNTITIDSDKNVKAIFVEINSDFAGGDGTESDPYRISTIDHLQNIDEDKYLDKHFIQTNNINAVSTSNWNNRQGFNPIGSDSSPFRGTYDGNGYEISRLTMNREDEEYVGMFGYVENGVVKNTGIRNATILGDAVVGGLVGNNNGQIINSYILGVVSGEEEVGGLVGRNQHVITGSYTEGSVSADDERTGGLAGYNLGNISHSYSHSEVGGDEDVGGLIGENRSTGSLEYSYATGRVRGDDQVGGLVGTNRGNITDSYWDTEGTDQRRATGRGSSRGTTGLLTSEMKGNIAINNMPEFDWDNIWRATPDYPIFRWQE